MATPQVPPRPTRSHLQPSSASTAPMDMPKVPARPGQRRLDRSVSPHRDSFARSPLNETPFSTSQSNIVSGVYGSWGNSASNLSLPPRPPSVSLPSIGQEGSEYADFDEPQIAPDDVTGLSPAQTRNVGSDLPLHAPKPSLTTAGAKARISTVTRTDSTQAAAVGIGKATTPVPAEDKEPSAKSVRPRASFSSRKSSVSTERPSSVIADSEHGIPEIGQRVPMYPNAGDVQAPSPSPFSQVFPAGIGFHNDGSKPRHHGRTRSGREVFQPPPGSYGLHGHGLASPDKFEQAWYDKHPEALVKEEGGQYGPGIGGSRGEWALSSDDLNKIVRETASRGAGFGTSPNIDGLPNEQIGYIASEEYAQRLASPRPHGGVYHSKAHSNHSQTHIESPLRKASFPIDETSQANLAKSRELSSTLKTPSEHAMESEAEDDDVIHVDAPDYRRSKYTGNGYDPPTEDLGPHGGNTESEGGYIEETGYGVPILASDEVAKEPGMEYMQPAVPPAQERRGSSYYVGAEPEGSPSYLGRHRHGSRSGSAASSRPSSRPGSIHGVPLGLARFTSHDDREDQHTPLEDVDEYEPLFPEEEEKKGGRASSLADRLKLRPDLNRRFPSQDIWEDAPDSVNLQATVSTPEPPPEEKPKDIEAPSTTFEPPEVEAARKGEVTEEDKARLIPKEERWAMSNFKPHLRDDLQRPNMKQRFPSRDVWEDSPDSSHLETTVGGPQTDDAQSPLSPQSPPDMGLIAGAIVHTAGRPDDPKLVTDQPREGATAGAAAVEKPSIPPRPAKSKHAEDSRSSNAPAPPSVPQRPQRTRQPPPVVAPSPLSRGSAESSPVGTAPSLPERAKPQVPARPVQTGGDGPADDAPLTKTVSGTSTASASSITDASTRPPVTKPKPMIPARPAGSKIAALKAGFMSDLDKRLQLGPQAPPKAQEKQVEEEKEEEKTPLADARKGRAKGPSRRKPAASPSAPADDAKPAIPRITISEPWTIWQIPTDGDDAVDAVHASKFSTPGEATPTSDAGITRANTAESEGKQASVPTLEEPKSETIPENVSSNPGLDSAQSQPPAASEASNLSPIGKESIVNPDSETMVREVANVEGEHHTEQTEV